MDACKTPFVSSAVLHALCCGDPWEPWGAEYTKPTAEPEGWLRAAGQVAGTGTPLRREGDRAVALSCGTRTRISPSEREGYTATAPQRRDGNPPQPLTAWG